MKPTAVFLIFALAIAAFAAQAEEVGRTKFELASPQWTLLTAYDTGLKFSGTTTGTGTILPVRHKVFQLLAPDGTVLALLDIGSTDGGIASTRWVSDMCPEPRAKYYTNDFGSNQTHRSRECLIVNESFGPHNYYKPDSEVIKAINEKGLKLFRSGYSLRTTYGARTGTLVRVNLMSQKSFKGLAGASPAATQLHDVPPELVAWGESLHKAVGDSALSMSGNLVLPPIEFKQ